MPYRKMLIAVGAFVIVMSVVMVFSLVYVIQKQGIFEKKYHYILIAETGENLSEGMPILFSGFEIGVVTKLTLLPEGVVEILIEIPEHQINWIKENTEFILNKPLIGTPSIMVLTKDLGGKMLPLDAKRFLDIKDGINELVAKVQPVLDDVQGIVRNVNTLTDAQSDMRKILKNVEVISGQVSRSNLVKNTDTITAEVGESIKALRHTMFNQDNGMVPELTQTVAQINKMVLSDNNSSIVHVNGILADVKSKLARLDGSVAAMNSLSQELDGLTADIKMSMKKTDEILETVNKLIGTAPQGEVTLP